GAAAARRPSALGGARGSDPGARRAAPVLGAAAGAAAPRGRARRVRARCAAARAGAARGGLGGAMERAEVAMTDAEFRMLAELLRAHCGLHFGSESRYLLERRLGRRLAELGLRSFTSYHYALRSDATGEAELAW